jgi:uncharacterized protein (DUF1501 family)
MTIRQTRRDFLLQTVPALATTAGLLACGGSGSGAADGGTGPLPPDPVPPTPEGYKALVAVFLFGGNDAYNMIVPASGSAYSAYAKARLELALPQAQLLSLGSADNGVPFAAHPAMSEFQSLYARGRATVLANVGPLAAPIANGQVRNASSLLPPRLFSHNDQSDQWQKTTAAGLESVGWAGRAADLLAPTLPGQVLPIGISYSGANLLQVGRTQVGFALGTGGAVEANFLRQTPALRALYAEMLATEQEHLFAQEYARGQQRGLDYNALIAAALAVAPAPAVSFPNDRLGQQLAAVAKLISVRARLGVQRQIFFVGLGGFDTHADQLERHQSLLRSLSQNLDAFYRATEAMGLAGNVTSFTASDFGRSLSVNGDGTDHGWGSHQLIVGGAVRGARFHGQMPDLAPGASRDYAGGRFAPSTSVDEYGSTLLRWFGIPASEMAAVFPNIGRFARPDLGFLS